MSPREDARTKGARMLGEGRLIVKRVDDDLVVATCRGDQGEIYDLGYDPRAGKWRCTCPARATCSHLRALMMVTVRRGTR